jgi:hypothetical protein
MVEILWISREDGNISLFRFPSSLLMFMLAEHLRLYQTASGSGADVHIMMRRIGISGELLRTWVCIAKVCNIVKSCSATERMFGRGTL